MAISLKQADEGRGNVVDKRQPQGESRNRVTKTGRRNKGITTPGEERNRPNRETRAEMAVSTHV